MEIEVDAHSPLALSHRTRPPIRASQVLGAIEQPFPVDYSPGHGNNNDMEPIRSDRDDADQQSLPTIGLPKTVQRCFKDVPRDAWRVV